MKSGRLENLMHIQLLGLTGTISERSSDGIAVIHHHYRRYGDEIVLAVPMKSVVYGYYTEEPRFEIRELKLKEFQVCIQRIITNSYPKSTRASSCVATRRRGIIRVSIVIACALIVAAKLSFQPAQHRFQLTGRSIQETEEPMQKIKAKQTSGAKSLHRIQSQPSLRPYD